MDGNEKNTCTTKETEGKSMAVSMAVVPTLKGKAATSILETIRTSKIKPYSDESKLDAERKIQELLQKRDSK